MKKLLNICAILVLGGSLVGQGNIDHSEAAEQHALLTEVLQDYVKDGMVNYEDLKEDGRFGKYIEQLAGTDPDNFSFREEKMAFWINAYNAYTLKIICDNYPLKSISELHTGGLVIATVFKKTVWHKPLVTINREITSLDHIEHEILRPVFDDPRIHFAIVCAAESCPPLRSEAYEADTLDSQLNDQAVRFLNQSGKNDFDRDRKVAVISPIFNWFKGDFAKDKAGLLIYLSQFLPEDVSQSINTSSKDWKVKYSSYDWSLNQQKKNDDKK